MLFQGNHNDSRLERDRERQLERRQGKIVENEKKLKMPQIPLSAKLEYKTLSQDLPPMHCERIEDAWGMH